MKHLLRISSICLSLLGVLAMPSLAAPAPPSEAPAAPEATPAPEVREVGPEVLPAAAGVEEGWFVLLNGEDRIG